jgi:hypothetical protein
MKRNISMKKKPKNYFYNLIGKFKYFIFIVVCVMALAIYYIFFKFKEGKITLDEYNKLADDAIYAENTAELKPLFSLSEYDVNRKIANDSRLNEMRSFIIKQPGSEAVVVTGGGEDPKTKAIKSVKPKELMIKIVDAIILGDINATAIKISDYSWSIQDAMKLETFDHTIEIAYEEIPNRIPQPMNDRFTDEYYLFYKQPRTILSYLLYPSLDYNNDGKNKPDSTIEYIKFDLKGGPLAYFEKEINTLLDLLYKVNGDIDILNKRTPFNGESPFYTFVKFASNPIGKYGTFDSLIDKDKYDNDITNRNITYNETSYSPSSPAPAAFPLINGPRNAGLQLLIKLIKKFGKWHGTDDFGDSKRILDISVPVWLINIRDPHLNAENVIKNRLNVQHGDLWWGMIEVWPYHNFYEIIINLLFDFTNWKKKDSNEKLVTDYMSISDPNGWTTFTPASKNNTSVIFLRNKIQTIMNNNKNWPLSGTPGV